MLTPYFKYFGVGHARMDGLDFWVQEFNSDPTSLTYTSPNDVYSIVPGEIANDEIESVNSSLSYYDLAMEVGDEKRLPIPERGLFPKRSYVYYGVPLYVEEVEWMGYDQNIISIDDSGYIIALSEGKDIPQPQK